MRKTLINPIIQQVDTENAKKRFNTLPTGRNPTVRPLRCTWNGLELLLAKAAAAAPDEQILGGFIGYLGGSRMKGFKGFRV